MGDSTEFCKNCKRNVSSANFASHSAFCERRIKLCEICDEPVQISQFKEHEDEYHSMVACEKCDLPLEKWMLPKHQESCSKRLVTCEFCEAEFPFDEYPEHKDFCGSRTEKCIYCRKYIMIKDKDVHYKNHQNEIKIQRMKDNVKSEIEQNSVNEVISKTHLIPQSEKILQFSEKESDETLQGEHVKRNQSPRRKLVAEATSSSSVRDESENFSKHYGECYICKEYIPWVDMNTHIPACACSAGKCSRCGESIPSNEIKEHILKTCPRLKRVPSIDGSDMEMSASGRDRSFEIAAANNPMPESIIEKSCPFCKQICDEERILEHIRICDQNTYECPLCSQVLPEKDKGMHESFYCEVLLNIQSDGRYPDMTRSKSEISRNNREGRNVESVVRNTEACPKCKNSFPKWCLEQHLQICHSGMKPCRFCGKSIRLENERNHLNNCPHVRSADVSSRLQYRIGAQNKGAVPKNQVKLEHEPEHVNCMKCPVCEAYVPVTDIENHCRSHESKKCCHNKKGKKCACQKQNSEGNSKGPFKQLWSHVKAWTKSDVKEGGCNTYEGNSQNALGYYQSPYEFDSYSNQHNESLYFSSIGNQDLIPCEFCEQTFPMSEIVLHSTGCKPDIVSFATKDTPEDVNTSTSSSLQQKRSTVASRQTSIERDRFFAEPRTSAAFSRHDYLKRSAHLLTKPGEFLDALNENTHNENVSKYENVKPEVDQAIKNQYSEVGDTKKSNIVSLWNFSSTSSNTSSNVRSLDKIPDFSNEVAEEHKKAKNSTSETSSYIKGNENEDDISVYVNYIHKKEVSNLYEEEEPQKHKNSEMEPISLKLSQAYSSRVKEASDDSASESENVESALEACETLESKMYEESSKIQDFVGENDKMDIDRISPEDNKSNEQKCAFKIEPATQCLSSEKKICKKTWKIKVVENKVVDEDSEQIDITKKCLANFKFGMNRNVACNENKMDFEEISVKDENENREAKPSKIEKAQKLLQNGTPRDKIAANFYDNIQESHDDFAKIAYKLYDDQKRLDDNIQENHDDFSKIAYKLYDDDQKRNSIETVDDEKEKLEKWIKWRSRKSSDSE